MKQKELKDLRVREQLCIHLKTVLHSTFWQEHIDSVPSWKSTSLPGHSMSLSKLRQQKKKPTYKPHILT